jgi:predicted RNase H-like HicB family nuclease
VTVDTHTHRYLVVIEGDGKTNYSAYSPDVPGCVAVGDTPEECETDMREALAFHLEGLALAGEPIPEPHTRASYVEVAAPAA